MTSKINKIKVAFLIYHGNYPQTIYDYIDSFPHFSRHEIILFDLSKINSFKLEDIADCDVIVFHYTVSIFWENLLPFHIKVFVRSLNKLKVLIIQDDYRLINLAHESMNYIGIHIVFSHLTELEKIYPFEKITTLRKRVKCLTGYVPQYLLPLYYQAPKFSERKFDVVYRSRKLSAWYGRLGLEKWTIAEKFQKGAFDYDLRCNLSVKEGERFNGKSWLEFLQSSKAALGVETGSSIYDFTGEIQKNTEAYEKENPNATFEEIEEHCFKGEDGKFLSQELSPRVFECAALGVLMILYEGKYSGVLTPWKHYVPLKKDHSNMEEVVSILKDESRWHTIVQTAYEEIALNPQYSYEHFVHQFDDVVEEGMGWIDNRSVSLKKKKNLFTFLSNVFWFLILKTLDFAKKIRRLMPQKIKISEEKKEKVRNIFSIIAEIEKNLKQKIHVTNYNDTLFNYFKSIKLMIFLKKVGIDLDLSSKIIYFDYCSMSLLNQSQISITFQDNKACIAIGSPYQDGQNTFFYDKLFQTIPSLKDLETLEINIMNSINVPELLRGKTFVFKK